MSSVMLKFDHVSAGYSKDKKILKDVDFTIEKGDFAALIGSNGTGKTTLIKCVSGLLPVCGGKIEICGRDQCELKAKERARLVAVVPQSYYVDYDFTVEDIVMMGRNPYNGFGRHNVSEDEKVVNHALKATNTDSLRNKKYNELSGGQRQRVIIARAIAQQPEILLLDEPTSALDTHYATEVMELIERLNREEGITVLAVIHDINMVSRYCKRIIMLKDGSIYADGTPSEIINKTYMTELYSMRLFIRENTLYEKPELMPVRVFNTEKVQCPKHIHIICGGGSGVSLIEALQDRGHNLTVGIITRQCDESVFCRFLGIPMVEADPYSMVTKEQAELNHKMMEAADVIIVADLFFGEMNIINLYDLENMRAELYIHDGVFRDDHDFTCDKKVRNRLELIGRRKQIYRFTNPGDIVDRVGQ